MNRLLRRLNYFFEIGSDAERSVSLRERGKEKGSVVGIHEPPGFVCDRDEE